MGGAPHAHRLASRLLRGPSVTNASLLHEAPLEVLRQRPDVVLELLALAGQALPPGPLAVTACATDATEVVPVLRSADFVALVHAEPTRSIELVVIAQLERWLDRVLEAPTLEDVFSES